MKAALDHIRNALFEIARILLTGVIIALVIVFAWDYFDRPTLETFRSEYGDASQADKERIAAHYLDLFSSAELIGTLRNAYGEDECHMQSQPIGRALYARHPDVAEALRLCPNSCSYGCFHGVMLEVFASGTPAFIASDVSAGERLSAVRRDAAAFCARTEVKAVAHTQFCTQGLGHVFQLLAGSDLESAVAACDALRTPGEIDSCVRGVFMEYLLNPQTMYESLSHGEAPCDSFPNHTAACYRFKAYHWITGWDGVAQALKACGALGTNADVCAEAVGRAGATESVLSDKAKLDAMCASVTDGRRESCLQGALTKLFDVHSTDIDHACATIDASLRDTCDHALDRYKSAFFYDR